MKTPEVPWILLPVIVAPEILVVKVAAIPVKFVNKPVLPVIVAPETLVVNVPVAPVNEVKLPVVAVMVTPETSVVKVPVTLLSIGNKPEKYTTKNYYRLD